MIPCSTSHNRGRRNSMGSLSNRGPSLSSTRSVSRDEEEEGPNVKKYRPAALSSFSTLRHPESMNDSLVAHLARAAAFNASRELQLWSDLGQRRSSLSSISSAYQEVEHSLSNHVARSNIRLPLGLASDDARFIWGNSEATFVEDQAHAAWQPQIRPSDVFRTSSLDTMQYSTSLTLTPNKRNREYEFDSAALQMSAVSDNSAVSQRRPSYMSDSTIHSWPVLPLPSPKPYVPEAETLTSRQSYRSSVTLQTETVTPKSLPAILAVPGDRFKLSASQIFLRYQIEAFEATEDDVETHLRGRNKKIKLGQVGIRCRHCAHLPAVMRQKGSVYFPATLLAIYQAAQNMSASHLQCGLCSQTPIAIKQHFAALLSVRAFSSGAGRPYWAEAGKKLGLVDTEEGIRFVA